MDTDLLILILFCATALFASALFSGLETGIYSLNRVRLHLLEHQNYRNANIIHRLMSNSSTLLVTLLISNNIANNIATSALGRIYEYAGYSPFEIVVYNILVLTPLLFVFAETLPKDLFSVHADRFVYPFARFLLLIKWLLTLCGLLPLVTWMGALTMRLLGGSAKQAVFHPRMQVASLVREGVGYGLLSDEQSALTGRVLRLAQRKLDEEMTPWEDVITIKSTASVDELWSLAKRSSISRYPVLNEQGAVLGMVSLHEALMYDKEHCPPVTDLIHELPRLDVATPIRRALRQLQDDKTAMGLVCENDQPVGIVTVKDVVEPLTGELASW
ncbi:MAG: CNNM domain-containing protein [Phycisphaeraceae bacterium JB051]